jgi:benzoylformate decarboxylase
MRTLVKKFLDKGISRRDFVKEMTILGFSLTAANSVVNTLSVAATDKDERPEVIKTVKGTGGTLLVETLKAADVKYVFCNPGSLEVDFLDVLLDNPDIKFILGLHEGIVLAMADGYSKASGETAFVNVHTVAGTSNTMSQLFNAHMDNSSIVVTSGQQSHQLLGHEPTLGIYDLKAIPSQFTRWTWDVKRADLIPLETHKAFKVASTQPGGPVFLSFPKNLLAQEGVAAKIAPQRMFKISTQIRPDSNLIKEAADLLIKSKSPILYLGDEIWKSQAISLAVDLAELLAIPVTDSHPSRRQAFKNFPTNHPLYIGGYEGAKMDYPKTHDLLVNFGANMFRPFYIDQIMRFPPGLKIIHVSIDSKEIGRNYPTDVPILADVKESLKALIAEITENTPEDELKRIREGRFARTKKYSNKLRKSGREVSAKDLDQVPISSTRLAWDLNKVLDKNAVIVNESLTSGKYLFEHMTFAPGERTYFGTSGSSLGWGTGAAIGVKLARPDRQVALMIGDGSFMFGPQALWTMARYEIPITTVIWNNRNYQAVRNAFNKIEKRAYETERYPGIYLGDPDIEFAKLAESMGVKGEQVINPAEIKPALERAAKSTREGKPYLVDVLIAREGKGADSSWHQEFSLASTRNEKV